MGENLPNLVTLTRNKIRELLQKHAVLLPLPFLYTE
jgi:hypothetical protein